MLNCWHYYPQIGVSRLQNSSSSVLPEKLINDSTENNMPSKNGHSSNTALVNFCDSAFLRTKRKLNPDGQKVLTIDSDYKLKKASSANSEPKHVDYGAQTSANESGYVFRCHVWCMRILGWSLPLCASLIIQPYRTSSGDHQWQDCNQRVVPGKQAPYLFSAWRWW